MMKYWLLVILLSTVVCSVDFSIDVPQTIGYGVDIPVDVVMENLNSVYGYEFVISSDLDYLSHQYLLNNTINSLVQPNQSSLRVVTIAQAGITNGSRAIVRFNYGSNTAGNFSFSITATAYSQNGTTMPVNLTGDEVVVEYDRLEIDAVITNDRSVNVQICMQNSKLINHTALTLEWNTTDMRLISASVPYNGSEIYLDNIIAHSNCENVAVLTFNVTAQYGSTIPISVVNLVTTSPYPIIAQNGQVRYDSFYVECTGTYAYRNTTAQVQVELFNSTAIDSWQYTVLSNISLVNGTNTIHRNKTATILFEIINQTNGVYPIILKDLTAIKGNDTFVQTLQAVCAINITTDCMDTDNDTYYYGTECNQTVLDCDDTRGDTYPNATEGCNSRDDDCDGLIDENNVCKTSTGSAGSGGSGGGASSSGSAGAGSASASSAGAVGFGNKMFGEESFKQQERPKEEHRPIQTHLAPGENEGKAMQKKPEPKKMNLVGNLFGVLVLLAAGIFLAYEHIKHKHKH
jgi:uncharacterized membrane protein YgcG